MLPESDISIIIEILERVEPSDPVEAAKSSQTSLLMSTVSLLCIPLDFISNH